jgi:hypothetical protein
MPATLSRRIAVEATDVSGQKRFTARDVPEDSTVTELLEGLLQPMQFPREDADGEIITYKARHEREHRHLHGSELVGTALRDRDRIVVQPEIHAGGAAGNGA